MKPRIFAFILTVFATVSSAIADVRYVNAAVSSSGAGTSWGAAYKTLQEALDDAAVNSAVTEIWVAAGTYRPSLRNPTTSGDARHATFLMLDGVSLYGGFDGTETVRTEADPTVNLTYLSGDLADDDDEAYSCTPSTTSCENRDDNSYHVVTAPSSIVNPTTFSGFIVTAGESRDRSSSLDAMGAGIHVDTSYLWVEDTFLFDNHAGENGGGFWASEGCDVRIYGSTVAYNSAFQGSGINVSGTSELLIINDCVVAYNRKHRTTSDANGLYASRVESVVIDDSQFYKNSSQVLSDILIDYHASSIVFVLSNIIMNNCDIGDNIMFGGNAVQLIDCVARFVECEFYDNFASNQSGAAIGTVSALGSGSGVELHIIDCLFERNSAGATYTSGPDSIRYGGAISVLPGASVFEIIGSSFEANYATGFGGAVSGNPHLVKSCFFNANTAGASGGAVFEGNVASHSARYFDCQFIDNLAGDLTGVSNEVPPLAEVGGGAVFVSPKESGALSAFAKCGFLANSGVPRASSDGAMGGAVHCEGDAYFANCQFLSNSASAGGGTINANRINTANPTFTIDMVHCNVLNGSAGASGIGGVDGSAFLANSIVWGNENDQLGGGAGASYSDIEGGFSGTGNINADPLFAGINYNLRICSPCLDTGSNALRGSDIGDVDDDGNTAEDLPVDWSNCNRVRQSTVNMGAYETCPADLDYNCSQNTQDFSAFINAFSSGSLEADFDCSGAVNSLDYGAFINYYNNTTCD
jgi:hypothetical protein